ncbi:Wzz/FepE/Etk N-terminal domain-containing protein [Modestobacter roseus]|uniref:Capsular polysaccharide biosynthesis protein n=1 Tax=Modestobacter roseus TaxID=1181884 RepID=A0A562IWW8_9ACTN|nr:Wzz/FepE/Etk N-terminal domain-containing protein [Modestobacter roseus]TWH75382.1 capsular polysaccharide biosynthesis protein [Modestobacter roseus]
MPEQPSTTGWTSGTTGPSRWTPSLGSVWRARWFVVGAAVVAGVGGYLVSQDQPPTYTADTRLVLSASEDFEPLGGRATNDASRFVANQASILGAPRVLQAAADELGDGTTLGELAEAVTVSASAESDVLVVEAVAGDAEEAAARADALATAYVQYRAARVVQEAEAAVAVTTDPATADQIRTAAVVYGDGIALVDPAEAPGSASTPRPLRTAVVLAVLAALAAAALAAAVGRRGPITDATVLVRAAGAPVLGAVPLARGAGSGAASGSEAFALTAVALDYVRPPGAGSVLVTGVTDDSGTAPVVRGLALAAADRGQRVLVVDAEAGHPLVGLLPGTAPAPRLDELETDRAEAGEATGRGVEAGRPGIRLAVLDRPAGRGSGEDVVRRQLERAAADQDLVLVSAGPLSLSSSAFALLRQAAAVVAVIAVTEDPVALGDVRDRLATAGRPLTGVVVTRAAATGRRGRSRRRRPVGGGSRAAGDGTGATSGDLVGPRRRAST